MEEKGVLFNRDVRMNSGGAVAGFLSDATEAVLKVEERLFNQVTDRSVKA